jgi:hypothetical protein
LGKRSGSSFAVSSSADSWSRADDFFVSIRVRLVMVPFQKDRAVGQQSLLVREKKVKRIFVKVL